MNYIKFKNKFIKYIFDSMFIFSNIIDYFIKIFI